MTRDIIEALPAGHIERSIVDVLEQESLPTNAPFWTLPDVNITPHSASHSSAAYDNVDGRRTLTPSRR